MSLEFEEQERLVEEFRAFLESEVWDESSADTLAEPVDLATLLGELASLKTEIRLESRQFKVALEDMRTLNQGLQEERARMLRELDRAREQSREAQQQAVRAQLLTLVDLRDRLAASHAAASERPARNWLARQFSSEALRLDKLTEGLGLILSRLDERLGEQGVRAMEVEGRPLDPRVARAIGVEQRVDLANGIVLRAVRRGYYHQDTPLRMAEVIVNKLEINHE